DSDQDLALDILVDDIPAAVVVLCTFLRKNHFQDLCLPAVHCLFSALRERQFTDLDRLADICRNDVYEETDPHTGYRTKVALHELRVSGVEIARDKPQY